MDRIYQGEEALCIHNAATGRELKFPNIISPSKIKKKIVVVGAGPGGLEAARIAAERGHEVVVFEAAPDPGGQIRLCAKSERRKDMIGIIDWRMQQCSKKNVKFNFNVVSRKSMMFLMKNLTQLLLQLEGCLILNFLKQKKT